MPINHHPWILVVCWKLIHWLQPFMNLGHPEESHPLAIAIHGSQECMFTNLCIPGYNHSQTPVVRSRILHSRTSTVHGILICAYINFGLNNRQHQLANHPWISTAPGQPDWFISQLSCWASHWNHSPMSHNLGFDTTVRELYRPPRGTR